MPPLLHFQAAPWLKTLKACSGSIEKRSWKREGACTSEPEPGDPRRRRAAPVAPASDVISAPQVGQLEGWPYPERGGDQLV